MFTASTVARPTAVRPMTVTLFHRKWSVHTSLRGLKMGARRRVSGLIASSRDAFRSEQETHARARLSGSDSPPRASGLT